MAFAKLKEWKDSIKRTALGLADTVIGKVEGVLAGITPKEEAEQKEAVEGFRKESKSFLDRVRSLRDKINSGKMMTAFTAQTIPVFRYADVEIDKFGNTRDFQGLSNALNASSREFDVIQNRQKAVEQIVGIVNSSPENWKVFKNEKTNTLDFVNFKNLGNDNSVYSISLSTGNSITARSFDELVGKSPVHQDMAGRLKGKIGLGDKYKNFFDKNSEDASAYVNKTNKLISMVEENLDKEAFRREENLSILSSYAQNMLDKNVNHPEKMAALSFIAANYDETISKSSLANSIIIKDNLSPENKLIINYDGSGKLDNIAFRSSNGASTIVYDSESKQFDMIDSLAYRRLIDRPVLKGLLSNELLEEIMQKHDGLGRAVEKPRKDEFLYNLQNTPIYTNDGLSKMKPSYTEPANNRFNSNLGNKEYKTNIKVMRKIEEQYDKTFPEAQVSFNEFNNSINVDYNGKHMSVLYDNKGELHSVFVRPEEGNYKNITPAFSNDVFNKICEKDETVKSLLKNIPDNNLLQRARNAEFIDKMAGMEKKSTERDER